jgi:cytochrome c oxidase subunit I+III
MTFDPLRTPPPDVAAQEARLLQVWQPPKGFRYFSEVNNSAVGMWYTATALAFLLYGGVLAVLMRIQLAVPENTFLTADQYNQIFTMHGTVMMFLFAVPIFEAISVLLLPAMLGARDLPFPRLSAYGYWSFLIGGVFVCSSLFFGAAPRGGWFMYPPLTSSYDMGIGADIWLLGLSFIEVAAIAAAVELIVGILKFRPPGMRINLIPLYCWYVLVVAGMILFAFPPLIAGDVLLEMERAFGWPFFDASRGGDPLLWQHLFWIFGHPEVYIIFLPSVALVAMIVPTFAQRPIVGYSWIVLAAVGTGFISFALWVHHMFTTGLPGISLSLFSAASMAVAIPTGVQIFCFIATLWGATRVRMGVPMLFVLAAVITFVVGGLTGVMVALVSFNFQAHDTHFVVAHLHSVLIGGAVFPILAGLYYFFPVATGRQLSERHGRLAFWLTLIGFNVTFLPMHFTGMRGLVRRVYTYPENLGFDALNLTSTIGALILVAGFVVVVWDVVRSRRAPVSERNPWNAGTLEWLSDMPPKPWGVRSVPDVGSRYPLWDQPDMDRAVNAGECFLPDAEEGRRETIATSVIDAEPLQALRLPGPSFLPMLAAAFTGGAFILATYHLWALGGVSLALAIATILRWLWTGTAEIPEKPEKDVGRGVRLPTYQSGQRGVGWWAMFITMLADMTAFISLAFGFLFYWMARPDFLSGYAGRPGAFWPVLSLLLGAGAWLLTMAAWRANGQDRSGAYYLSLAGGAALALGSAAAMLAGPALTGLEPERHVYPAMVWLLAGWTALHLAIGVLMQGYCVARRAAGRMTAIHDIDIANVTLYWHFAAFTVLVTTLVIAGLPLLLR